MATAQGHNFTLSVMGRDAQAYLAGEGSGGPGVLVMHAWWGLTPIFKQLCDRLAGEGYVALAANLFGDKTAGTRAEAEALLPMEQTDGEWMQAVALAALDRLRAASRPGGAVGLIGFSMGAAWASVLSTLRPDEVRAVVLFYGTYPIDFSRAKAGFQGHFAEQDEFEPPEAVAAMQEAVEKAGLSATFHTYPGTGHWFFENNQQSAYHPGAAELAWARTLAFLEERLGK